jgi:hypothetical protein
MDGEKQDDGGVERVWGFDPNELNDYDPPAYLRRRVAERVRRNVPLLPEWAVRDCAKWEVKDEWNETGKRMEELE